MSILYYCSIPALLRRQRGGVGERGEGEFRVLVGVEEGERMTYFEGVEGGLLLLVYWCWCWCYFYCLLLILTTSPFFIKQKTNQNQNRRSLYPPYLHSSPPPSPPPYHHHPQIPTQTHLQTASLSSLFLSLPSPPLFSPPCGKNSSKKSRKMWISSFWEGT